MSQGTHFDDVAAVYDHALPSHVVEHYLAKRVSFIESVLPPPGRVVDVGCGTGSLAVRLAALGYEVVGIDPSAGMLELLRGRAPEVDAVQGSATRMPFPDGRFDLSISVADDAPHRRSGRGPARAGRDGAGRPAGRPHHRLGPQPA